MLNFLFQIPNLDMTNHGVPMLPHLLPHQQPPELSYFGHAPKRNASAPSMFSNPVVETKYMVTRQGPLGSSGQTNTAASFFAKAHQRLQAHQLNQQTASVVSTSSSSPQLSHNGHRRRRGRSTEASEEREQFPTNFRTLVHRSPPQIPAGLLRRLEDTSSTQNGLGKIRVFVRVSQATNCFDPMQQQEYSRHFQMDKKKRQVTLYDPSAFRGQGHDLSQPPEDRRVGVAAPKMFAFDGLFSSDDTHEDVCSQALPDIIHSVINGNDGCLFCFGHANLGKTRSMLGSDQCAKDMGAIPIAIAWLFRAIKERKAKAGTRFSVRVSAMEINNQREDIRDLLAPYETPDEQSPAIYLRSLPVNGSCLQNLSELRASSAEKAAHYLDAALAGRSLDAQGRESHLIFTIHVYQYSAEAAAGGGRGGTYGGGRSRFHLVDFGGCERTKTQGRGITLSGLGNVILGIFNGLKHLPHRESKVTQVLRECLGSLTCQAAMLAHVSPEASHYSETLHTVQLASRLHRSRRKRMKNSGSGGSAGSNSSDELRRMSKFKSRSSGSSGRSSSEFTSGTSTNASSSEMSCDTVVYRGHSDGSGTDCEHPPMFLPTLRSLAGGSSGGSSGQGSLVGSLDEISRPRRRAGSKILTNGAISPRRNLSPQPVHLLRSPNRSLSSLPVIHEVNTNSRKMPLNGLVPVPNRQRRAGPPEPEMEAHPPPSFSARKEVWIDADPRDERNFLSPQSQKRYGYMDEHKANMISTWVEHQTAESHFKALTQFKTCESDETQQTEVLNHAAIVHETSLTNGNPVNKRQPPPPPPRRTPPRDSNERRFEVAKMDNHEVQRAREGQQLVMVMADNDPQQHPLRILSEENLTIVSSFAASQENLEAGGDHDEVDPSKLSFFEVPDFNTMKEDMDKQDNFISKRFKEFAQLERSIGKGNEESKNQNSPGGSEYLLTFNRNIINNNNNSSSSNEMETSIQTDNFLQSPNNNCSDEVTHVSKLTPQKQFLYLAQSLRHPDGSSNPELHISSETLPEPSQQRLPGNGRESPELIEDNIRVAKEESCQIADVEKQSKKPARFAFRFLKIFGSTRKLDSNKARSKSCERKDLNRDQLFRGSLRSACSSPNVKDKSKEVTVALPTPSEMSISTEWEFQNNDDDDSKVQDNRNGNIAQQQRMLASLFDVNGKLTATPGPAVKTDRKSSGYDSLGGDSSSLDSNQEAEVPYATPQIPAVNVSPKDLQIVQYDEIDILRMEQRMKYAKC